MSGAYDFDFLERTPSVCEREGGKGLARMALHLEAMSLDATDVESASHAVRQSTEIRSVASEDHSSREVFKEAQELLVQVLSILNNPICESHPSAVWSLRLARAHTLTLLDQVAKLVDLP